MTMLYQFKEMMKNQFNAGSKAVFDAREIAARCGAKTINIYRLTEVDFPFLPKWVNRLLGWIVWKFQQPRIQRVIEDGGWLFIQHPITTSRSLLNAASGRRFVESMKVSKDLRVVALLHDVDEARYGSGDSPGGEASTATIFSIADKVIVHNACMRKVLVKRGFPPEKMVELGIFDYLSDRPRAAPTAKNFRKIVFAGNLRPDKCGFLSHIPELGDLKWLLFGKKVAESNLSFKQVQYGGCLPPDELTAHLTEGFGLVWDGDTVDGCGGKYGSYLKINNPHKCSLYLSAGLPVIVWKQSALAKFVEGQGVGIAVESLRELKGVLDALSEKDYLAMREKVAGVSDKLRGGSYLTQALIAAMK